jgi:hypothetical protein
MTAKVCIAQLSFAIVAKTVNAWRISLTNTGTIMTAAMGAPRRAAA